MATTPPLLTDSQKRGRILLVAALGVMAAILVQPIIEEAWRTPGIWPKTMVGNGLLLAMLFPAYWGGIWAMRLARVIAVLGLAAAAIPLVPAAALGAMEIPIAEPFPLAARLLGFAEGAVVAFAFWALSFSREVRDFVNWRRALVDGSPEM